MDTMEKIESVAELGGGADELTVVVSAETAADKLVDAVRTTLAYLVDDGDVESSSAAVSLIEAQLLVFEGESPLTENLRPWQLLASDLAVALEEVDSTLSQRARAVADQFRSIISMMKRNPANELALRHSSRLVLDALRQLGGRATAEAVRQVSGHSASHLSNILKPLRGHGLVKEDTDPSDKRRKMLSLTHAGRSRMRETENQHIPATTAETQFESALIRRASPVAGATIYTSNIGKVVERKSAGVS